MASYYVRQCKMERQNKDSTSVIVAWIPEKFAVKGKLIDLKENGEWDRGFTVVSVSEVRRTSSEAVKRSQWHKKHRKRTDV